ncbi:putative membrane protein [Frigoribacterium sp. CG_9.8]|nr:putative membrane protein [Frigoribacterium sp. CG_9.8]
MWIVIGRQDAQQTKAYSSREEPNRAAADLLLLILSIVALFSVAFVLVQASSAHGVTKLLLVLLALLSIALSWLLLHEV